MKLLLSTLKIGLVNGRFLRWILSSYGNLPSIDLTWTESVKHNQFQEKYKMIRLFPFQQLFLFIIYSFNSEQ